MSAKRVFVLSFSLLLLLRFAEFVASTPVDFVKEEKVSGAAGPIIVGQASYRPPYRQQYGLAIGEVLLDFHDLGFRAGNLQDNEPSIELVNWCIELGHAHMDDAELGVFFEDKSTTNRESHPKLYHIELALQAYDYASKTLFQMTKETEFIDMDPVFEANRDKMVHLHYYAIVEYSKGEAFTISAEEAMMSSTSSREFYSEALGAYRKAQASYQKLRYIYAKLSKAASNTKPTNNDYDDDDDDDDDEYFNEDRYYLIENYYAHSCFQLGVSLYSKLILDQNDKINRNNEKIMQLSKLGMEEEEELDIVTALMDQANGGMGGGRTGGNNAAFSSESVRELTDMLEGNWMEGGIGGDNSKEWKTALEAIAGHLDTAILTYHQHVNPSKSDEYDDKQKPMKVFLNGVPRKTIRDLEEDERLFPWRSSLAMAYEKAATVATMLNQHIRSRELMNNALELYSDDILPYYSEQESRERRLARNINTGNRGNSSPSSMSAMSREYAEVSIGRLYVTLTDTTVKLGGYEDSKEAYSKAMDWYTKHKLTPEPDGVFNSLHGDEVALHQYENFANSFRQELDQYFKNVKTGYVYKDDSYEAGMLLSIAPLYMAMGKAEPAIRFYKDAILAYERVTTEDLTNKSNRMTLLDLADARLGLSSAYFHHMRYADSKAQHSIYCQIHQDIYGEGNPPQTDNTAFLEEMQDEIIETYGKDYYEQLKAYYGGSSDTGKGTGLGKEGSNAPKVATNFIAFVHDNETMWDDEDDYESDDDEKETWSNEEL